MSPVSSDVDIRTRRARRATAVVFVAHGVVVGSFAARLPWIAGHVGVDVGDLGVALLMPGIGAVLAMPFAGRLVHRYSFPALVGVTGCAYCAALVLPSLPTSFALLCVSLFVVGATAGLADAMMNAHAVLVERLYGRSIMSSLHGFWSVGALAGSAASALAAGVGIDPRAQFAVTAVVLGIVVVLASRRFLPNDPERVAVEPPAFALPTGPVLLMGIVALCAVFGEHAGLDWSSVYLRRELGASAGIAALAVTAFSVAMAAVRLVGDHVIRRLGPVATVRAAGACAAVGAVAVAFAPGLALGLVGFAFLGAGVALVVPLVFAAAGRVGPHPARSVAGVAVVAYGAGLVAPGVIGGVASASSLSVSFLLVAALVVLMVVCAGALRATRAVRTSSGAPPGPRPYRSGSRSRAPLARAGSSRPRHVPARSVRRRP
jgi:predicted MFS family arabinose efflux permease